MPTIQRVRHDRVLQPTDHRGIFAVNAAKNASLMIMKRSLRALFLAVFAIVRSSSVAAAEAPSVLVVFAMHA
jgi:hypothetical protein